MSGVHPLELATLPPGESFCSTRSFISTPRNPMLAEGTFLNTGPSEQFPVSFIIPAHNETKFIGKTIQAIKEAADSVEIDYEIIVVNDASSDETAAIASENGARVINVALRNIGAVRNAGAAVAHYPWLIFVDADTIVPTKTLAKTVDALTDGVVGGGARVVIDETQSLFFVKRIMYLSLVVVWQVIGRWAAGCYMFCRKADFESFGGFDEQYFAAEEYFFSRQVKSRGRFILVTHPVVTSARKLHGYSTWQLTKFVLTPLTNFRSMLKTRAGLDILYRDQR